MGTASRECGPSLGKGLDYPTHLLLPSQVTCPLDIAGRESRGGRAGSFASGCPGSIRNGEEMSHNKQVWSAEQMCGLTVLGHIVSDPRALGLLSFGENGLTRRQER